MEQSLIKLLVPKEMLIHFDFEGYKDDRGVYRLYLVEKDDLSYSKRDMLESPCVSCWL